MRRIGMRLLSCFSWLVILLLTVLFFEQRYVSVTSLAPAVGCLIMVLQALIYRNANPNETGYHPGFSESNEEVARKKNKTLARIIIWFIPFQLLLILFFHGTVKIVGAIALLLFPFLILPVLTAVQTNKR